VNRRLTARGRERRRQIMEHAATRFADNGYHPTSVADIVTGLGVGKGVFYWYFDSKEELFRELLREAQHDLRRRQQQAIGAEPDPIRRLELGIRGSMQWFDEHRHLCKLFQLAATDERFAPTLRAGQQVAVADVVGHVKEGMVEGRLADGDAELVAHAIIGVTSHLARTFLLERGEGAEAVAEAAIAFCRGGLQGR
jgi:TetR/AcrR family transcriptional regulator, cholesterol catabolism regulator